MVFDVFVVILNNLYVEPLSIASFYKIHQCLSCVVYALTERNMQCIPCCDKFDRTLHPHLYSAMQKNKSDINVLTFHGVECLLSLASLIAILNLTNSQFRSDLLK